MKKANDTIFSILTHSGMGLVRIGLKGENSEEFSEIFLRIHSCICLCNVHPSFTEKLEGPSSFIVQGAKDFSMA